MADRAQIGRGAVAVLVYQFTGRRRPPLDLARVEGSETFLQAA